MLVSIMWHSLTFLQVLPRREITQAPLSPITPTTRSLRKCHTGWSRTFHQPLPLSQWNTAEPNLISLSHAIYYAHQMTKIIQSSPFINFVKCVAFMIKKQNQIVQEFPEHYAQNRQTENIDIQTKAELISVNNLNQCSCFNAWLNQANNKAPLSSSPAINRSLVTGL